MASSFSSASAATAATLPDLVVTNIVKPAAAPGTPVTFTATVKNQGTMATPAGMIIGVQFQVDGKNPVTWSDTDKASLAPGASVTLTANGGPGGRRVERDDGDPLGAGLRRRRQPHGGTE